MAYQCVWTNGLKGTKLLKIIFLFNFGRSGIYGNKIIEETVK